jgi:hypothetical protein
MPRGVSVVLNDVVGPIPALTVHQYSLIQPYGQAGITKVLGVCVRAMQW